MNGVNKTLYIPLYGKAYVSRKGILLRDPKAEEIWSAEGFALKGKSRSKWLAYYMAIRAAVFDDWVKQQMAENADAVVVHIGCGLDSRVLRVGAVEHRWFDVDLPKVIEQRSRYYAESASYRMIAGDARKDDWLAEFPQQADAIVVMEGVSMYLTTEELQRLTDALCSHFRSVSLLVDCYTALGARLSRYKNPVLDVGVTRVYGMEAPEVLENGTLRFVGEHTMMPQRFIDEMNPVERRIFQKLYAGPFSRKIYKLFEYRMICKVKTDQKCEEDFGCLY